MTALRKSQAGFTLFELLIAMTIFSVILLTGAAMLIQVGKMYYRGVVASNNREVTRQVVDEISDPIQLEGASVIPSGTQVTYVPTTGTQMRVDAFCIGNKRYSFAKGVFLDSSVTAGTVVSGANGTMRAKHVLWVDANPDPTICMPADLSIAIPNSNGGTELLDGGMMLSDLYLNANTTIPGKIFYDLRVSIITGADDLITAGPPWQCKAGVVGSQWCANSDISTNVFKRIE